MNNTGVNGTYLPQRVGDRRAAAGSAPLVLLTDALPGAAADQGSTVHADDPIAAALLATVSRGRGVWIGRGTSTAAHPSAVFRRRPLSLDEADVVGYDDGHARATLWPLYHDLGTARYDHAWRTAYRSVNTAFAAAAANEAAPGATVWVHGYKLQLVPGILRRLRPDLRIGLYLQTPFPAANQFHYMPNHQQVLMGLLGADLVGFQTPGAAENFLRLTHDVTGVPPNVGVFPTSVDTAAIRALATRSDVIARAALLRKQLGNPRHILLSINPPDANQGIQRNLLGLGTLFADGRLPADDTVVVQIVLPGPSGPDPQIMDDIARSAARVNGLHASVGRPCVHSVRANPDLAERVALYLAADVLLATPLREGATATALEFVAAARDDAAVVLSEFSGSAAMLPTAYLVNPNDIDALSSGLRAALTATTAERAQRLRPMRQYVVDYDTYCWARNFLAALRAAPARPAGRIDAISLRTRRPLQGQRIRTPWPIHDHTVGGP